MPSSKGYKRNYKQELATEKRNHPERAKLRAERNRARYQEMKMGKVHPHDNKDVDHIKPLSQGGSNRPANLRVRSPHSNRSYRRTSAGAIRKK